MSKKTVSFHEWDDKAGKYALYVLSEENDWDVSEFRSAKTDEGWDSSWIRYYLDEDNEGECVIREWGAAGSDCDGRVESSGEDYCYLQNLAVRPMYGHDPDTSPILLPDWVSIDKRQRDFTAEECGY